MYCMNCGKEVPDATKFCPYCGAGLMGRSPAGGSPGTGPDQTPPGGYPPASPPTPPAPKKRRWPFVVAAVFAVLVIAVAAFLFLMGGTGDDVLPDDEEAALTEVYYSETEAVPVVLGSTTIVFYSDDGEELEEYDLYLMDGEGAFAHHHVDAETGAFTPDRYGVEPGTYRMIVREPETNTVHTVNQIVVVDEDATDTTDFDDDTDYIYYEDELDIKPDPDDSEDSSTTSARQAAYTLYYERVLELQELYGEGEFVDDGYGGATITGVAFVGLVDIARDGDDIEELVVVYGTETEWFDGTIEVWTYDEEANDIALVCEEPFGATDDVVSLEIYDFGDVCWVRWSYWGNGTFDYYIVDTGEDGTAVAHAFSADYNSEIYLVDHEEVTAEEYDSAFMDYAIGDLAGADTRYFYLWVYSTEDRSGEDYTTYDPTDTLAYTQETIEALRFGMMDLTEDELWGGDGTDTAESDLVRYEEVLDFLYDGLTTSWEGYEDLYYEEGTGYEAISWLWYWYDTYEEPSSAGYAFVDLDGDGANELVVGGVDDDGTYTLLDLYTIVDGEVVNIASVGERWTYWICPDLTIAYMGSSSAFTTTYEYYQLVDGALMLVEMVSYDEYEDADNPWFYGTSSGSLASTTESEARAIMDSHTDVLELDMTTFSEYER